VERDASGTGGDEEREVHWHIVSKLDLISVQSNV
jgi:hypothetical protein